MSSFALPLTHIILPLKLHGKALTSDSSEERTAQNNRVSEIPVTVPDAYPALSTPSSCLRNRPDARMLLLSKLTVYARQEMQNFLSGKPNNPEYSYELFRRAIVENNTDAWNSIHKLYESTVLKWVKAHPSFSTSGENANYFVNRTFEKFWKALSPDKFKRFLALKSLLSYLQTCVHSVIIDYVRKQNVPEIGIDELYEGTQHRLPAWRDMTNDPSSVETMVIMQIEKQALWEQIDSRLKNNKERIVMRACFVLGMKPRELYEYAPETFQGVQEIYGIKQNVLARLSRDQEFKQYFRVE